ncbi:MAG TPA: entericidin A/B family lipoprotein [Burkholderiales bacterium]|jgi:predicted small secreted protein|nr:entericidin A/B family lipoprotein [Burkholderiales bacterium]
MKQVVILIWAMLSLTLAACNTIEGMGKDIRKAGESIEKAVK